MIDVIKFFSDIDNPNTYTTKIDSIPIPTSFIMEMYILVFKV